MYDSMQRRHPMMFVFGGELKTDDVTVRVSNVEGEDADGTGIRHTRKITLTAGRTTAHLYTYAVPAPLHVMTLNDKVIKEIDINRR